MLLRPDSTASIARYELKYLVCADVVPRLMEALSCHCAADTHASTDAEGYYSIDSLYFDNDRFDLFRLTEEGVPIRSKIRVRSYISPAGRSAQVKLEVKLRQHAMVTKTSVSAPLETWQDWIRHPAGAPAMSGQAEQAAFNRFCLETLRYRATPKLMVRITFDRRLKAQAAPDYGFHPDPALWQAIDNGAAHGGQSPVIMEIKFLNNPPSWAVQLVRRFGLHPQSFSKYGNAMFRRLRETPHGQDHQTIHHPLLWTAA